MVFMGFFTISNLYVNSKLSFYAYDVTSNVAYYVV